MPGSGLRRFRAAAPRILAGAAACAVLLAILFFPHAGTYLIREDPLEKSDAIVVLAGERVQRWLEAADLYREGWAPVIVLSPGQADEAEPILRQRGIRFPSETDLIRDGLRQLNVPDEAVLAMPGTVDSTAQEGSVLASVVSQHHWRRVIVVTSKYHTRRARFATIRALRGTGATVLMRATRYDRSIPRRWWTSRKDTRWVITEYQKLLAYRLGLSQ